MKIPSYLHPILGMALLIVVACGKNESEGNSTKALPSDKEINEKNSASKSSSKETISEADFLAWLPMNHVGFTREKEPWSDHGDLPRIQVRYISDEDPAKRFTLDVLDGKGPLVVAVKGMITANLSRVYDEELLDGYSKVYTHQGIKAFERHTPADGKSFLHYAVADRFYFKFEGEQVNPKVFWEFQKILDPSELDR